MNLGKCFRCGMLISYKDYPICKDCNNIIYKKIKDYIMTNGKKSIEELHKELGLPIDLLETYYESGDLYISEESKKELNEKLEKLNEIKQLLNESKDNTDNIKDNTSGFHSSYRRK